MAFAGYDIGNWHLVGHSLGAQLAGIVGRQIKHLSNDSLILPRYGVVQSFVRFSQASRLPFFRNNHSIKVQNSVAHKKVMEAYETILF